MCIVFVSMSHPDYPLILADNRDEFILRPTSRPHWWTHTSPTNGHTTRILSSRDLHRPERGTWLGVTETGQIAVLTNYREVDAAGPSPKGRRSRGGMVTGFLSEPPAEYIGDSVRRLVEEGEGVKGVGGFSMACGKMARRGDGFAIVSNRADTLGDVPIVPAGQGRCWGLTNTTFRNGGTWPKLRDGLTPFDEIVEGTQGAAKGEKAEGALLERLFAHLSRDTLVGHEDRSLAENIQDLKTSIFIPALGGAKQRAEMEEARAQGRGTWPTDDELVAEAPEHGVVTGEQSHEDVGFERGMYGTQRQTVVIVDREGQVVFVERALWDANGHAIPKGEGDVVFRFGIKGWAG
ncbi:NRDE protein-domain-containing protein [Emericellopsis atlantica]|uniref:NRDE protein-domain-containing protein n=1 Tax=Emericellopsis atlantica TaxID=2614577 RepID=A0A9P7ZMN1_9HYPO|nr:NRDE protein-domain-containing protein [Emericellopsis atlantica]KAG9254741.1 NRDE protein-domain-containing protein [Emericellopsis atlantica]